MIKKSIIDIQKIIKQIIIKSQEENTFNCTIYNFLLNIDGIYIPSPYDFNKIVVCDKDILLNNFFETFIFTYPLYIIFMTNYFMKYNYIIGEFFKLIQKFMEGFASSVFNVLDNNEENEHNPTGQMNYLNLIYFISEHMLIAYFGKITDEEIYNNLEFHLPYCIKCKKKMENYLILSKYLSQCFFCGEKYLYINTNYFYKYLIEGKQHLINFVEESLFNIITSITLDILFKYKEKEQNKNNVALFNYSLYYKIMKEHFCFLNRVQKIIGKNIPFIVDKNILKKLNNNNDINIEMENEQTLEKIFDNLFEEFSDNKKYPLKKIYESINNDLFISFNAYRKTIKHEIALVKNKYKKK